MQKHVNLVDLVKSFPTNTYLQNLASIQKRTSPVKFAHLAEKSENGSIPNLSTKVFTETQISDAMRQLTPVWRKREDGFWEDAETDEDKRARAVELLQEKLAK